MQSYFHHDNVTVTTSESYDNEQNLVSIPLLPNADKNNAFEKCLMQPELSGETYVQLEFSEKIRVRTALIVPCEYSNQTLPN